MLPDYSLPYKALHFNLMILHQHHNQFCLPAGIKPAPSTL